MAEEPPGPGWYAATALFYLALPILDRLLLQPANDPSLIGFFLNMGLLALTASWALIGGKRSPGPSGGYDATGLAAFIGVLIGTIIVFIWIPWE